jgi:kynurenine formamidase
MSVTSATLPSYAELLEREDAPPGSSWGLFERPDLGTLNFIDERTVVEAMSLARQGRKINLDLALDAISTPTSFQRGPIEHVVFGNGWCHHDDHLRLYMQAATHFDSLRHMRHFRYGFYEGIDPAEVEAGRRLGIDHIARSGIVGRAVLADIPRYLERHGRVQLDHREGEAFAVELLAETLRDQGTERRPGDIVLMRTGWLRHYFDELSEREREELPGRLRSPGLVQSHETLGWLWDTRVAAIVADNAGVECFPPVSSSPFDPEVPDDAGVVPRLAHPTIIALMGFLIGELWWLEDLAADCAEDGVYEALFMADPLHLTGGVGSPANAIAIK